MIYLRPNFLRDTGTALSHGLVPMRLLIFLSSCLLILGSFSLALYFITIGIGASWNFLIKNLCCNFSQTASKIFPQRLITSSKTDFTVIGMHSANFVTSASFNNAGRLFDKYLDVCSGQVKSQMGSIGEASIVVSRSILGSIFC